MIESKLCDLGIEKAKYQDERVNNSDIMRPRLQQPNLKKMPIEMTGWIWEV